MINDFKLNNNKILILYFTGTYNTRYLVNNLISKLINVGKVDDSNILKIEIDYKTKLLTKEELKDYSLIFLLYPIHSFNIPLTFINYFKTIINNFNNNSKFIIIKQSGEYLKVNNSSSYEIYKYLKKNKFSIKNVNEYHLILPYNIHFKFKDETVKLLLIYLNKELDLIINDLINNKIHKIKTNIFITLNSFIFRIQRKANNFISSTYTIDNTKCNKCYKCVSNCPTNNIKKDKETNIISFNNKRCVICMRCSFYCPKDAISIGILNKWRVNGDYNYNKILDDNNIIPKIDRSDVGNSRIIYKSIIKKIKEIDFKEKK